MSDCSVRSHLERALHIAGALRPRQPDLLLGRPHPPQRFGIDPDAALPLDDARQRAGLVVAAAPAAPPVQRYRDQHVGLLEQFTAGPRHPAAHGRRQVGAVLVFQRVHQCLARRRRSAPRRGRAHRPADRRSPPSTTVRGRDRRQRECRAAGSRRRDERQFRPAGGADAFAVDRFAAGDAQGRQRDVEREPRGMFPCAPARVERAAQMAGDGTGW